MRFVKMGKLTGRLYPPDYNAEKISECCHNITEDRLRDPIFLSNLKAQDVIDCYNCGGCPEWTKHKSLQS